VVDEVIRVCCRGGGSCSSRLGVVQLTVQRVDLVLQARLRQLRIFQLTSKVLHLLFQLRSVVMEGGWRAGRQQATTTTHERARMAWYGTQQRVSHIQAQEFSYHDVPAGVQLHDTAQTHLSRAPCRRRSRSARFDGLTFKLRTSLLKFLDAAGGSTRPVFLLRRRLSPLFNLPEHTRGRSAFMLLVRMAHPQPRNAKQRNTPHHTTPHHTTPHLSLQQVRVFQERLLDLAQ